MIDLPFKTKGYPSTGFDAKLDNVKDEKDLKGDDIKKILRMKFSNTEFLTTEERNHIGVNENPFDFIVGHPDKLDMFGFEIKGDTDDFSRLPKQIQSYSFVFEDVFLVLHKKQPPKWLPEYVGILRVFEDGDVYIESHGYSRELLGISTEYEWDALFKNNGITMNSKRTRKILRIVEDVRRNVLFNRFFAIHDGFNTKRFKRWWELDDEQKAVIIGFDVPEHYKNLKKDITLFEKRFNQLREIINLGDKGLKDFQKQL